MIEIERSQSGKPLGRLVLLMLWLPSLGLLLVGLGDAPVRRTQEARVLETAREMLGGGLRAWLVPHINGRVRLEKPPLAYWLTAGSFKLLGVSDFSGRLPNVISGWLTLGVTYLIARRLFGIRAALLSAACLLSSYYFVWNTRLAETDALATLFVTIGIFFVWRFVDTHEPVAATPASPLVRGGDAGVAATEKRASWIDAHASAAAIALAILAKGPPAAFIVIFLLLLVAVHNRWKKLIEWTLSGAPLTVAVIALPWFLYIHSLPEWHVVSDEFAIAVGGREHRGPFYLYFPQSLLGITPWSGLMIVALIGAIARCRRDARLRGLLCWIVAIFVPLCLAGQKQPHYLLPLMPALAVLTGCAIDVAQADRKLRGPTRILFVATVIGVLLCAPAILLIKWNAQSVLQLGDYLLAAGAALAGILALQAFKRGIVAASLCLAASMCVLLIAANAWWLPSIYPTSPRTAAAEIRARFGDGPYVLFGPNESYPLVWELRSVIPRAQSAEELVKLSREQGSVVAIAQAKNDVVPPPPPEGFVERRPPAMVEDQAFRLYTRDAR